MQEGISSQDADRRAVAAMASAFTSEPFAFVR